MPPTNNKPSEPDYKALYENPNAYNIYRSVRMAETIAHNARYNVLALKLDKTEISELKDLRLAALDLVNQANEIALNCSNAIAEKKIIPQNSLPKK